MNIIQVHSEQEFAALPDSFDIMTEIQIRCDGVELRLNKKNGIYTAYGSSQVRAYDSSQVTAYGSSQVRAYDSSQVRAYGSSQVTAYDSSQVRAYHSSKVTAYDSSQVTAYGSSQVTAYGSSQVRAYGSSQVTAYGSSQVRAYDSSQVRAYGSSQVTAYHSSVSIKELLHNAILINFDGAKPNVGKQSKTAQIIQQKAFIHAKASFLDIYPADSDGFVTLYKVVNDNNKDYYTNTIEYKGTVTCPDWDKNPNRQCGGGLHLSPLPELALKYNNGKILKCRVHKKNFVVYGSDITKVRCREVEVIEEVKANF